jgi:hypothetical protein
MGKQCIPGIICVENTVLFIVGVFLVCFFFYFYIDVQRERGREYAQSPSQSPVIVNVASQRTPYDYRDVLLNPYAAPYNDQNYMSPTVSPFAYGSRGGVPSNFRQIGILTHKEGGSVLPLMGRPIDNRKDLWNYYTISDQHNNVKLPIQVGGSCKDCRGRQVRSGGKNGLSEYGVNQLNGGDNVYLDGINKDYHVTLYDSNMPF